MSTLVNVVLSGSAPQLMSMAHFRPSYSGRSLFQLCVERNAPFAGRQIIIGHNDFHAQAKGSLKTLGNKDCLSIIEEDRLTNLYSVAFAAFSAGSEDIILVTPSFYLISNGAGYREAIEKMIELAGQDKIAMLAFEADQGIEYMPFFEVEDNKVINIELAEDVRRFKMLARSKKHLAHSGIICTKASVYLKELKAIAPEVFKAAQAIWKSRVGQYVAAEARQKVPLVSFEESILPGSAKIEIVIQASSRLQTTVNNTSGKIIENYKRHPNGGHGNGESAMLNIAM